MKWILLTIGILTELGGSTCMKLSYGFTKIYPSILTFIFWGISFSVFILALKQFDLSYAYAIWAGLGILLVSMVGMVYFKESINPLKVISIIIIAIGVVALNLSEIIYKSNAP